MHFLSAVAIREGKVETVLGHARTDRCHGSMDRPAKLPRVQGIVRDHHVPMICYTTTEWNFCLPLEVVRMFYLSLYFCTLIAFAIDHGLAGSGRRGFIRSTWATGRNPGHVRWLSGVPRWQMVAVNPHEYIP